MTVYSDTAIDKRKYEITNYFEGVTSRHTKKNNEIISAAEFNKLLNCITPENGMRSFESTNRRNQYRPWLSNAFRLAIETGLRTEEFMMIKFSHINCNQDSTPLYIEVPNYKVNRIKGEEHSDNKKYVPSQKEC